MFWGETISLAWNNSITTNTCMYPEMDAIPKARYHVIRGYWIKTSRQIFEWKWIHIEKINLIRCLLHDPIRVGFLVYLVSIMVGCSMKQNQSSTKWVEKKKN